MRLMNVTALQKLSKDPSYHTSMEGQMNFRRSTGDKFRKWYFVLKGNLLFYFAKKSDRAPTGLVIIEGYTVELSNEEDGYCFQLIRRPNGSVTSSMTFVVVNAEVLEAWLSALTNCSYGQLKVSAERIAELIANKTDKNPKDEDKAASEEEKADESENSFEELHETYGNKIKEILTAPKSDD